MARTGGMTAMLLCFAVLLTGCWNYRELNDLALAMAEGIDKTPGKDEYRFSFQIVNSREIVGAKATGDIPVIVFADSGKTLLEAARNASKHVPRRISAQHMRVIVIGEEVARQGIEEMFDLLERDPEVRMTTRVLIAKGFDAETILQSVTPLEPIPANAILGKVKVTGKVLAESYETEIHDVIRGLRTEGGGPVISGIKLTGSPQAGEKKSNKETTDTPAVLQTSGMALFKKGKLAGWVSGSKARGLARISNNMRGTVMNLDCGEKKSAVAIELLQANTKVTGHMEGDRPVIRLEVEQIGFVEEAMCPVDLSKSAVIRDFEQLLNEETKRELSAAVQAAQKLKTDVLGFGAAIERSDSRAWHRIKKEWDVLFSKAKVEISVHSSIRRTGMTSKPHMFKEKD